MNINAILFNDLVQDLCPLDVVLKMYIMTQLQSDSIDANIIEQWTDYFD